MSSTPEIDLCQIPAGPPPEGVSSNFVDPPSLGPALMAVMGITVGWGIIFTGARLYINTRKLGWSDYCVTIALLMAIATLGIETQQLRVAHHIWDIPACFFDAEFAKGVYIPAVLFQMGAFFAKTSILLLFHQLFNVKRPIRISIWVGHVFNFLIYAVGIAVALLRDTPYRRAVDGHARRAHLGAGPLVAAAVGAHSPSRSLYFCSSITSTCQAESSDEAKARAHRGVFACVDGYRCQHRVPGAAHRNHTQQ